MEVKNTERTATKEANNNSRSTNQYDVEIAKIKTTHEKEMETLHTQSSVTNEHDVKIAQYMADIKRVEAEYDQQIERYRIEREMELKEKQIANQRFGQIMDTVKVGLIAAGTATFLTLSSYFANGREIAKIERGIE